MNRHKQNLLFAVFAVIVGYHAIVRYAGPMSDPHMAALKTKAQAERQARLDAINQVVDKTENKTETPPSK